MSSFFHDRKRGKRERERVFGRVGVKRKGGKGGGGGVCQLVGRRGRALRWLSINR